MSLECGCACELQYMTFCFLEGTSKAAALCNYSRSDTDFEKDKIIFASPSFEKFFFCYLEGLGRILNKTTMSVA